MRTKNADSIRPTALATTILGLGLGLGAALALATALFPATPAHGASNVVGARSPRGAMKEPIDRAAPPRITTADTMTSAPRQSPSAPAATEFSPPDPCTTDPDEIDCNHNGTNDRCGIVAGMADVNLNWIPHTCELAWRDLDLDGSVDARDHLLALNDWGSEGHDANGDGITNALDLAIVLSNRSSTG